MWIAKVWRGWLFHEILQEQRHRRFFFSLSLHQCRILFIRPLLPKMSWSVLLLLLLLLFFPPPPLVPPAPSSTHAVIQWKISAINLCTYGFTIVAALWTPSFRCPAVWKAGVQKLSSWLDCRLFPFFLFFLKTYLWKAVCLLSFPFRYSAKPDLLCFFFFMSHEATLRRPTVDESDDQWDDSVSVVIWAVFYNVGLSWMDGWIQRTLKCPMIYIRPLRSSNSSNGWRKAAFYTPYISI